MSRVRPVAGHGASDAVEARVGGLSRGEWRRRGVFASAPGELSGWIVQDPQGFLESQLRHGRTGIATEVIDARFISPPQHVADALEVGSREQIFALQRLRSLDGKIAMFSTNWFPQDVGQEDRGCRGRPGRNRIGEQHPCGGLVPDQRRASRHSRDACAGDRRQPPSDRPGSAGTCGCDHFRGTTKTCGSTTTRLGCSRMSSRCRGERRRQLNPCLTRMPHVSVRGCAFGPPSAPSFRIRVRRGAASGEDVDFKTAVRAWRPGAHLLGLELNRSRIQPILLRLAPRHHR